MAKIYPKKSLGQNFLVNRGVVEKIVAASNIEKEENIIEVGSGRGILTEALSDAGAKVWAIEKDHRLIPALKEQFSGQKNVQITDLDVLKLDPRNLGLTDRNYKIIANIPYYITSHFIREVFTKWPLPSLVVLMVQREVAQRITAKPPDMNILALSVQFYGQPKIVSVVRAGSFSPAPTVDSAILRIEPYSTIKRDIEEKFFKLIKAGFAHKRKKLINNLQHIREQPDLILILEKLSHDKNARAGQLSLDDWFYLSEQLS